MQIDMDKSSAFSMMVNSARERSVPKLVPYLERYLDMKPTVEAKIEFDDFARPPRRKERFSPSSDCMRCKRDLFFQMCGRDIPCDDHIDGHTRMVFNVGTATHALVQAYLKDMSTIDGFPHEHGEGAETRMWAPEYRMSGYIDDVLDFPRFDSPVALEIKGFALDTEIPTPYGFKNMADIEVGDEVFAGDGTICSVVQKSPIHHKKTYRVTFDTGASFICDEDHRWEVVTNADLSNNTSRVMNVAEMIERGVKYADGRRKFRVSLCGAAQYPHKDLPIDPYVFGVWIADGTAASGSVSKPIEHSCWDEMASRGYSFGRDVNRKNNRCCTRTVLGIRGHLDALGVLGNKHIPDTYMRGSVSQRLDLLRGIMDGDGTWSYKRHQALLSTTSKMYAMQVKELMESLGMRVTWCEYLSHGFGKSVWTYSVRTSGYPYNPFLCRNQDIVINAKRSKHRYIDSIEEVESVPTQCIAVDSVDHTYLVGREYIRTHNTINHRGFDMLKAPKPEHRWQIGCYLMATGFDGGILLYIDKDTQKFKEFWVEEMDMQPVLSRWQSVIDALDADDVGLLPYECVDGSRQHEWCVYRDVCRNIEH